MSTTTFRIEIKDFFPEISSGAICFATEPDVCSIRKKPFLNHETYFVQGILERSLAALQSLHILPIVEASRLISRPSATARITNTTKSTGTAHSAVWSPKCSAERPKAGGAKRRPP